MTINVRPAAAADRERCLQLLMMLGGPEGRALPEGAAALFDDLLTAARGQILVAEEDGAVLGMATQSYNIALRYGGEYAQLEELIVDPTARGKNVGGRLLAAAIDAAQTRGAAEFGLYLLAWTEHNRPFYEKFGLKAVGSEMRMALPAR